MKKNALGLFAVLFCIINLNAQPVFTGDYSTVNLGCNPLPFTISSTLGGANASDACAAPTITSVTGDVQFSGCQRSQTRVFTATDACGFTASIARTVTWIFDLSSPDFIGDYSTISLGCNPGQAAIEHALGTAGAGDECGVEAVLVLNDQLDFQGCNFSQTRTFVAVDACGNTAQRSRTVTWREDVTPPVFVGSVSNVFIGCNPSTAEITSALGSASSNDQCGIPTFTFIDGTVQSSGCSRSQTRKIIASDACGNTATRSRTVSWIDDVTPPVFTGSYALVDLGYEPTASQIDAALGEATTFDACSTAIVAKSDGLIQSTGCNRQQTRTFTATDVCGNFATISRTVQWKQGCELTISIGEITVSENVGTALVPVTLLYPTNVTVSVNYKTVNGTAKHPKDFTHVAGTLTFSAGQTTQYISITINTDNIPEADEDFSILLSGAVNAVIDDGMGKVTIAASVPGSMTKSIVQPEINNDQQALANLYVPNPQRRVDFLRFNGIQEGSFNIILNDISGKRIASCKNYRNNLALSNLLPGLYFYQVQISNGRGQIRTGKLLITH